MEVTLTEINVIIQKSQCQRDSLIYRSTKVYNTEYPI